MGRLLVGPLGVNHVYGTGAVLPALEACGFTPHHPVIRKAVDSGSTPSSGIRVASAEDIRSYHEAAMRGRGTATPSQTAGRY